MVIGFPNLIFNSASPGRNQSHARQHQQKTAYFTLCCNSLTVGTDHQPLIPIINGTDMEKVKTPKQTEIKADEVGPEGGLHTRQVPGRHRRPVVR